MACRLSAHSAHTTTTSYRKLKKVVDILIAGHCYFGSEARAPVPTDQLGGRAIGRIIFRPLFPTRASLHFNESSLHHLSGRLARPHTWRWQTLGQWCYCTLLSIRHTCRHGRLQICHHHGSTASCPRLFSETSHMDMPRRNNIGSLLEEPWASRDDLR